MKGRERRGVNGAGAGRVWDGMLIFFANLGVPLVCLIVLHGEAAVGM